MNAKYSGKQVTPFPFKGDWYLHLPLNGGGFEQLYFETEEKAKEAANKHNKQYSTCYVLIE